VKKSANYLKWLKLGGVLGMLLHLSRRLREKKASVLSSTKAFVWIYSYKR